MSGKLGGLLPLYLRREPSPELNAPTYHGRRAFDVVAYANPDATRKKARWLWDCSHKPRKGAKQASTIVMNCFRWTAIWLPDVIERVK